MNQDRFQYCLSQLKRFDHDRYLAILLTPEKYRASLAAFYAFDVEMARIPTTVSEPMLADIRFQWWRDTLAKMVPGSDPGHEIASAVSDSFFDRGIAPKELLPLIDFRARDLAEQPFRTFDELDEYQRGIAALHLKFASSITGEALDTATSETAISHLLVYGLINQLRRLPHDAASSQFCLPLDLMGLHNLDPHDLFQGMPTPGLSSAIDEILDHAEDLMLQAGDLDLRSNTALVPAMLPTVLRSLYIQKLRSPGFDLFRTSSEIPAFRRQLRYLRVRWSRQFQG